MQDERVVGRNSQLKLQKRLESEVVFTYLCVFVCVCVLQTTGIVVVDEHYCDLERYEMHFYLHTSINTNFYLPTCVCVYVQLYIFTHFYFIFMGFHAYLFLCKLLLY